MSICNPSDSVVLDFRGGWARGSTIRFARRNYTPPNKAMHRKLDPSLRLATPSLSPASSSADLNR